jgi:nitrate reductase / nitrite oxidoreductase, alpha subunit
MSMISYASGSRMLQLMGGVGLSFYDWYCDLPSASPETWGEQTDVQESADWYNAKYTGSGCCRWPTTSRSARRSCGSPP